MKEGLPQQIEYYLKRNYPQWYAKGTLTADITWRHERGKNYGILYLPETVGRALRSLEESSIIAVKEDGISVQYKWLPFDLRKKYIPFSSRTDSKLLFNKNIS